MVLSILCRRNSSDPIILSGGTLTLSDHGSAFCDLTLACPGCVLPLLVPMPWLGLQCLTVFLTSLDLLSPSLWLNPVLPLCPLKKEDQWADMYLQKVPKKESSLVPTGEWTLPNNRRSTQGQLARSMCGGRDPGEQASGGTKCLHLCEGVSAT